MENIELRLSDCSRPHQRPKAFHGLRLTLAGSLDLHAAVDIFDRFHCSLLVSKEKKNSQVPKHPLAVLLRGQTWQHYAPRTMVSQSLNPDSRFLCHLLSRLAKNIECSSLFDWLADHIVKAHLQTCFRTPYALRYFSRDKIQYFRTLRPHVFFRGQTGK